MDLNFKARTIASTLADYFPIDFNVSETDRPSYHNCGAGVDEVFHFDSIKRLYLPGSDVFDIRVTVLNDATLIAFRVSHYICDAQSIYTIAEAYCNLIAGKPIPDLVLPTICQIPPELSPDMRTQPTTFSTGSALVLSTNDMHTVGAVIFIRWVILCLIQAVWETFGLPNSPKEGYIFVPDDIVNRWRDDCQHGLDNTSDQSSVRLSKLDVLVAWHFQVYILLFYPQI